MTSFLIQIVEAGHKLAGTNLSIIDKWVGFFMLARLSEKHMVMMRAPKYVAKYDTGVQKLAPANDKRIVECYKCEQSVHCYHQYENIGVSSSLWSQKKFTNVFSAVFNNGNCQKNNVDGDQ